MDHQAPPTKKKTGRPPTPAEQRLGLVLIGVLLLTGAGLLVVQSHFDPATWRDQPQESKAVVPAATGKAAADPPGDEAPAGLKALGPAENYDPESLSDKIDGKAEFYLAAGFRQLATRRFVLASDKGRWLERYVYDMGHSRGAFAVFSGQRRPSPEPLTLTADAYRSANGLFLTHGRFYLEIVASDLSAELLSQMEILARRFVDSHPKAPEAPDERRFLPAENRLAHSTALIAAHAFGIERLDWIYTAQYRWNAAEATAFVSRRASAKEAEDLAEAFAAYFTEYGGEKIALPGTHPTLRAFDVLDSVEVVFTLDSYLAGVHEAGDREQALALADRLLRNLQEADRGQ
jgi:hypothetical protein